MLHPYFNCPLANLSPAVPRAGSMYEAATAVQLRALLRGDRDEAEAHASALILQPVNNEAAHMLAHGGYNQEYSSDDRLQRISAKYASSCVMQVYY